MGIVQKIFYFHVPSAYAMYIGATACFVGSVDVPAEADRRARRARASRRRGRDRVRRASSSSPARSGPRRRGATTGRGIRASRPRCSAWLIYVAYLVLRGFSGDGAGERKFAAALGILGAANLPDHPLQRAEVGRAAPHRHHRQGRRPPAPRHEDRARARLRRLHALRRRAPLGARAARARAEPARPRRRRRHRSRARRSDGA